MLLSTAGFLFALLWLRVPQVGPGAFPWNGPPTVEDLAEPEARIALRTQLLRALDRDLWAAGWKGDPDVLAGVWTLAALEQGWLAVPSADERAMVGRLRGALAEGLESASSGWVTRAAVQVLAPGSPRPRDPSAPVPAASGGEAAAAQFLARDLAAQEPVARWQILLGETRPSGVLYREAVEWLASRGRGGGLAPAEPRSLLLAVLALDQSRMGWVEAGPAEEVFWPRRVLAEVVRCLPPRGQPLETSIARPSAAAILLTLSVLEPWLRIPEDRRPSPDSLEVARLREDCAGCHEGLQPNMVAEWERSAHGRQNVSCADCHGLNHSLIFREEGRVSPRVCAECHATAVEEFAHSSHAEAMDRLEASALFASTPADLRASCLGCHQIGARHRDGARGSCNACHTGHRFEAADARRPEACTVCHTGEDYPQDRAYQLSRHGALDRITQDPLTAPTCASCHHPRGTHDDGFGLTLGRSGVGACLEGDTPAIPMPTLTAEEFRARRGEMVTMCADCHGRRFAESSLREADATRRAASLQLAAAADLLRSVQQEGLVPMDWPIGGDQVRLDPALPGAALWNSFYEMWRFHYNEVFKGAYHQSPSVANRSSLSGLSHDVERIRHLADQLRRGELDR